MLDKEMCDSIHHIVSPKCKGDMEYDQENQRLTCSACKIRYRIDAAIPLILIDEAEKIDKTESSCNKCSMLSELYENTPKSNRDYWVMTELFVMLHGSDICRRDKKDG